MILKGSQRGGAKNLALHLLKTEENEHVELREVRAFMAEDVTGALREAEAVAKGTRCPQFLFSVSLSPPQHESVRPELFERAIDRIEQRNGLTGQPRVVIFHEKEGRRHAHAVWSRIDAETMTARPLPFYKTRLREVSKELYLEHGWQMPRGLIDTHARDPPEGQSWFNRIGSAFAHKDGKGFNVVLDAMPVDGRITLRTAEQRLEQARRGEGGVLRAQGRDREKDRERDRER